MFSIAKQLKHISDVIDTAKTVYGNIDWRRIKHRDLEMVKKMFDRFAKNITSNDVNIIFPHCRYVFPGHSWSRARSSGVSFKGMLKNTLPETFLTLFAIGRIPGVDIVELSSLWRPWGGTAHPGGFGIDIIRLGNIQTARWSRTPEPNGLKEIRNAIWGTGLISQWIGAWQVRLSPAGDWHANPANVPGDNRVQPIYSQHVDHLHLTVRR